MSAWIPEEGIKPYEPYKEQMTKQNKTAPFREAVEAIEDYMLKMRDVPIKTSDLPSIDEEIAAIFPNGSNRSPPHKDYSRQPFQTKPKGKNSSDAEIPKTNATSNVKPKPQSVPSSSSTITSTLPINETKEPKEIKKDKPKKNGYRKTGRTGKNVRKQKDITAVSATPGPKLSIKRTADGGAGSSGSKRPKLGEKLNDKSSPPLATSSHLSSSIPTTNHSSPRKAAESLLMRPTYVTRPVTPPLDIEKVSETLKRKNVKPSCLKFGFLGLGIMGQGIVKNLINSGHSVTVWNRTPSKCRDFVKAGAVKGQTPADVVAASDITFSCVADPQAAKDMVFGNCGVLQDMRGPKGYVEMTTVDAETSQDIAEAIMARGGRYLEAQLQGSKAQAEEGTLIILSAGDRSLFDDCQTCFQAMGKSSFYLGDVGNAAKMNLVINLMMGTVLAGLAEGMALADRAGLQQKDVLEVLELSALSCPTVLDKGKAIIEGAFPTSFPLQHMQKDLRLALSMGDQLEQPLPVTATANEVFKHAKRLGYGEHDVSAVYIRARF